MTDSQLFTCHTSSQFKFQLAIWNCYSTSRQQLGLCLEAVQHCYWSLGRDRLLLIVEKFATKTENAVSENFPHWPGSWRDKLFLR